MARIKPLASCRSAAEVKSAGGISSILVRTTVLLMTCSATSLRPWHRRRQIACRVCVQLLITTRICSETDRCLFTLTPSRQVFLLTQLNDGGGLKWRFLLGSVKIISKDISRFSRRLLQLAHHLTGCWQQERWCMYHQRICTIRLPGYQVCSIDAIWRRSNRRSLDDAIFSSRVQCRAESNALLKSRPITQTNRLSTSRAACRSGLQTSNQ